MRPLSTLFTLTVALCVQGCGPAEPDPRIRTPQATVETLLRANHLWELMSLHAGGPMPRRDDLDTPPPDIEVVALCFWDYDRDDPDSRAMGEFVTGMLAGGLHRLEYRTGQRQAIVRSGDRLIYMVQSRQGWQIVLRDTVPDEIREGLRKGRFRRLRRDHEIL